MTASYVPGAFKQLKSMEISPEGLLPGDEPALKVQPEGGTYVNPIHPLTVIFQNHYNQQIIMPNF